MYNSSLINLYPVLLGLKPDLNCIRGRSTRDCMDKIRLGDADMIALDAADVFVAGKYVKYLYLETLSLKFKPRFRSRLGLKSRNIMGNIRYNKSFPLQVLWVGANCSRRLFRLRS